MSSLHLQGPVLQEGVGREGIVTALGNVSSIRRSPVVNEQGLFDLPVNASPIEESHTASTLVQNSVLLQQVVIRGPIH